jgi:ABC-type uncharacterized transport system fused permease/ATPase subunit
MTIPEKIAALSAIFNLNSAMFTSWGGLTQFFNYFSINLGNNARITEMLDVFDDIEKEKNQKKINVNEENNISTSVNDDENKIEINDKIDEKYSLIEMQSMNDEDVPYKHKVSFVDNLVSFKNLSVFTPNHNLLISKLNLTSKKENLIVQGP